MIGVALRTLDVSGGPPLTLRRASPALAAGVEDPGAVGDEAQECCDEVGEHEDGELDGVARGRGEAAEQGERARGEAEAEGEHREAFEVAAPGVPAAADAERQPAVR